MNFIFSLGTNIGIEIDKLTIIFNYYFLSYFNV